MTDDSKIYNSKIYTDAQPEAVDNGQIAAQDSATLYSKLSIRRGLENQKFAAYTVKLPADQLAALQSIWLELKRLYGADSPDKSGMIQQAIAGWLKRWDGPDKQELLRDLLDIRRDTRRRQYKK